MKQLGILLALLMPCIAAADDLDLFRGQPVTAPARIMLLIDTSGSMQGLLVKENTDGTPYLVDGKEVPPDDNSTSDFDDQYDGTCYEADDLSVAVGGVYNNANRKFCRLKKVIKQLLGEWPDSVEVGLARYAEPGAVIEAPLMALGDQYSLDENGTLSTHRVRLGNVLDSLILGATIKNRRKITYGGWTPLAGSYLEVAQYLTGGKPVSQYSNDYSFHQWYDAEGQFHSIWDDASTKLNYHAPSLDAVCDNFNAHLIVLTDGESTRENMANAGTYEIGYGHYISFAGSETQTLGQRFGELVGGADSDDDGYMDECPVDEVSPYIWDCVNSLAQKLATFNTVNADGVSTPHYVKTSTIAFSLGTLDAFMETWAEKGSGAFYSAQNEDDLEGAFQNIGEMAISEGTFTATAPGLSVNQTNRFSHVDELYYSLFEPSSRPFWYGNLKKYKLAFNDEGEVIIADSRGNPADANGDGFFDKGIRSFWLNAGEPADGEVVHLGGAAEKIDSFAARNLFVDLGVYSTNKFMTNIRSSTDTANLTSFVTEIGANYVAEDLVDDAADGNRNKVERTVDWLRGEDVADEWFGLTGTERDDRTLYGAPIHSSPILVNYRSTNGVLPLALEDQDNMVFISTNDGKLYGVDANTGAEQFAFIPKALSHRSASGVSSFLDNAYTAATTNTDGAFLYGLDSSWTAWRQDRNGDGNITPSGSNDFVYLFGGMRRGGSNYYSLDVTGAFSASPSIRQRFVLEAGQTGSPFLNMGQTWSEPTLALMKYNGKSVAVMLVGGGYDPIYDGAGLVDGTDPKGSQVFAVMAYPNSELGKQAGDVLWWAADTNVAGASPAANTSGYLHHSIPSTVKVLDRDRDGYIDHIYVGDMGGQIHRFDIVQTDTRDALGNVTSTATSINYNIVAQLGHAGIGVDARTDANRRRFFFPPSLALMNDSAGNYVGIAIGSGLLTSPNDTAVDEQFYFIKDREPFGTTQDIFAHANTIGRTPVTDLSLVEFGEDAPAESFTTTSSAVAGSMMQPAEKFLGSPIILNGHVYFTTYYSADADASGPQCTATTGKAALYDYIPGTNYISQLKVEMPQSAAGTLSVILMNNPEGTGDLTDIVGLPGGPASAIPLGDLPNQVRKTRWFQCPDPADAACGG